MQMDNSDAQNQRLNGLAAIVEVSLLLAEGHYFRRERWAEALGQAPTMWPELLACWAV